MLPSFFDYSAVKHPQIIYLKNAASNLRNVQAANYYIVNERANVYEFFAFVISEGIPAKAENYLLSAESIITDIMGTDNEYTKSVYKYLYNLYARWHKTELAGEYREKCLTWIHTNLYPVTFPVQSPS